jgi:septal ring factor EnvC (AmiA/AmiB activator)
MRSLVALLTFVLAASFAAYPLKDESLEQLIARVGSARAEDQPHLYIEIARKEVEAAGKSYKAGENDAARKSVDEVVTYSAKASDAASHTGKKLKDTEIALRKMAEKLRDLKRGLAYEDQAPVQAAADKLEQMRTELLGRMFGKKERP